MAGERHFDAIVSGQSRSLHARLCRPLLALASVPYGWVAARRRRAYRTGRKRSYPAGVPVISVGNITAGGTGKTPLVAYLVRHMAESDRSPAILTRGYKAVAGRSDEAELLKRLTGVTVVVNPDRVAGAQSAVAAGADVLVMDDGFQHMRLRRDLDIVTIDATRPFGYGAVLPRGLLREPVDALSDANVIVITRCDQVDTATLESLRRRLAALAPGAAVAESVMAPIALRGFDGRERPVDSLAGAKVWAFCGVGNPESFYGTLEALGARLVGRSRFDDHYAYQDRDIARLIDRARSADAVPMTTAKDAVRLDGLAGAKEIRWLQIEVRLRSGEAALHDRLDKVLRAATVD